MSLVGLIILLIVIGVVLYLVETALPMDPTIKRIIIVLVVLAVIIFILQRFAVV